HEDRVHLVGSLIELAAEERIGGLVGRDGKVAVLEVRGSEVLTIAHRMPGEEILLALGRARQQFEQHDRFVEVVEVVGGEPGRRVDVGAVQLCEVDRRGRGGREWARSGRRHYISISPMTRSYPGSVAMAR